MAELNKGQLASENNNSFPNNNAGLITPTALRTFNGNMIDSLVDEITYGADSASFSASIASLKNFSSSLDATFATDAQLTALSTSVAVTDSGQDSKINAIIAATSSFITESETGSMSVLSSSYAVTASYAANAGASINTGSFATTGSNTFIGNQNITGAIFQSSSTANEFTRIQIANSNKPFFGEANTLLSLVGDSQGIFDFYADGGNYDTLNIVVNQNNGTTFRDWKGNAYNNWLKIPTNTGANPAPQFLRGLGVTGSVAITGDITARSASFQYVQTIYETASVIFSSGSNQLGDELSDTQILSGSVQVQGLFTVNGVSPVYENQTGSMSVLSASYANVATSASFASTATSASFATNAGLLDGKDSTEFATTGSNTFTSNQTITGSLRVDGDFFLDDDGGTTSFLMNSKFNTEFLGSQWRWFESAKKFQWDVFEEIVDLNLSAYGTGYDNGLAINLRSDGTTFSDYNTSFVTQSWLRIPVNNNNNPAPQFPRGLGITGSLDANGINIINELNGLSSQTSSYARNNTGNTFTGGDQKITGSVRIDGDLIIDDDGGTTSFLINQRFTTEFLGSNLRWQEANKKVTWEVFESQVQLAFSGYSASYDNGLIVDIKNDGTTFSDYNTSFVNQPWLNIPVNNNTNPAPQFKRGLASTGSITIQSGSGDLYMYGHKMFNSAEFYSTTTQSGSAGVSGSITFNNSGSVNGITLANNSQLTVANAGIYNIQFSAQIETSAGADTAYVWFKKNGTNISDSATKVVLANNTAQVMTVNILDEAVANDYYELGYQFTNGNATILSEAASGNIPAVPSVIATITQAR